MAIKISGTTVIDDSRNICNAASLTAGGVSYPTSDGSSGQALTTNGSGTLSFSDVGGEQYPVFTACSNFTSGDPVVSRCAGQAESPVFDPFACCVTDPQITCFGGEHRCMQCNIIPLQLSSLQLVNFCCNPNCVAIVGYYGGYCSCCAQHCCCPIDECWGKEGCYAVYAATLDDTGAFSNITCICEGQLCVCKRGATFAGCTFLAINRAQGQNEYASSRPAYTVASCSGTVAYHVMPYQNRVICCSFCRCCNIWAQTKLCYCTATEEISIISLTCCECAAPCSGLCAVGRDYFYFATPDNCYTIIEMFMNDCDCCKCWFCSNTSVCLSVQVNDDSMNLIDFSTYATMVCGPSGGFKAYMGSCNSCYQNWDRYVDKGTDTNSYAVGSFHTGGFMHSTYGRDGWILAHFDFDISCCICCNTCAANQCSEQKFFAFRPVGQQQFELTCNCICAMCLYCAGNTHFPAWKNINCRACCSCNGKMGSVSGCNTSDAQYGSQYPIQVSGFDIGNNIKVLQSSWTNEQCCRTQHGLMCFCITSSRNICPLSGQTSAMQFMSNCKGDSCGALLEGNFGRWNKFRPSRPFEKRYGARDYQFRDFLPLCRCCGCMVYAAGIINREFQIIGTYCCYQINNGLAHREMSYGCCDAEGRGIHIFNMYLDPTNCICNCTYNCILNCNSGVNTSLVSFDCQPFVPYQCICYFCNCLASNGSGNCPANNNWTYSLHKVSDDAIVGIQNGTHNSPNLGASNDPDHFACTCQQCRKFKFVNFYGPNVQAQAQYFMGVAQNTASAGQTVCIAVPGMIDNSDIIENTFPDSYKCFCMPICISAQEATGADTSLWFGGTAPQNRFCHYPNACGLILTRFCNPVTCTTSGIWHQWERI